MAGGRPSKYNDETLSTATDYIVNFADYDDVIPSVAGLACALEVCRDTIYDWASQEGKAEFSDIVKRLSTYQERKLLNGGLNGTLNPMISKLILSKHGYAEKSEVDNKSSDGSMTPKAYAPEQYSQAQSKLDNEIDSLD